MCYKIFARDENNDVKNMLYKPYVNKLNEHGQAYIQDTSEYCVKTLRDYIPNYVTLSDDFFPLEYVAQAFAELLSMRVNEVYMTPKEFKSFVMRFCEQLPHDWDGNAFWGVTIKRTKNESTV